MKGALHAVEERAGEVAADEWGAGHTVEVGAFAAGNHAGDVVEITDAEFLHELGREDRDGAGDIENGFRRAEDGVAGPGGGQQTAGGRRGGLGDDEFFEFGDAARSVGRFRGCLGKQPTKKWAGKRK